MSHQRDLERGRCDYPNPLRVEWNLREEERREKYIKKKAIKPTNHIPSNPKKSHTIK
jgi:hypothetical protein